MTKSDTQPRRLPFLDGLRGMAALYVLLFHAATVTLEHEPSPTVKLLQGVLAEGRLAVVFFIVLSGYSLMLPIARSGTNVLIGGFPDYIRRRSRRILPPYYAALFVSIALIVVYNLLAARLGLGKPVDSALDTGSIVSHLLLVHNLSFEWAFRINGPMWSVATEWQIYFLFPFLLLPLRSRLGDVGTLVFAWVLGSLPFFLLPLDQSFFWACPWFLGSFALGMFGACIGFSPAYAESTLRKRVPWGFLTWLVLLALVLGFSSGWAKSLGYPLIDFGVSLFAFCWINAGMRDQAREQRGPVFAFLGSKAAVYLGGFSYSVYLVQHPVLRLTEKAMARLQLGPDAIVVLHLLLAVPFVVAVAWVFSELVERPVTGGGILLPALRRRFVRPAATPAQPGP